MALINAILFYARLILVVSIVIGILTIGFLYYLIKIKKIAAKEEKIDYSTFRRSDPKEYVKFDNIISDTPDTLKKAGIIVINSNVFVAALDVTMSDDYATKSASGRQQIMAGAITFWNSIQDSIQLRQNVQAIDMGDTIEKYEKKLEEISEAGMQLQEDYEDTVRQAKEYEDSAEETVAYEKKIRDLQHQIRAKKHMADEVSEVLRYCKLLSGNKEAQQANQFVYSYVFNPDEFTVEMTKEEIYNKAISELKLKGEIYTDAYAACGCRCKRLSASDLVLLLRKQLHPYYSDDITMEDIFNSSYNSLFVTSDSLVDIAKERIGEEEYQKRLDELYLKYNERKKTLHDESEKERELMLQEAERVAREQMKNAAEEAY